MQASENHEKFWAEQAKNLIWFKNGIKYLIGYRPFAKWFVGGTLNASVNCLDRHVRF